MLITKLQQLNKFLQLKLMQKDLFRPLITDFQLLMNLISVQACLKSLVLAKGWVTFNGQYLAPLIYFSRAMIIVQTASSTGMEVSNLPHQVCNKCLSWLIIIIHLAWPHGPNFQMATQWRSNIPINGSIYLQI